MWPTWDSEGYLNESLGHLVTLFARSARPPAAHPNKIGLPQQPVIIGLAVTQETSFEAQISLLPGLNVPSLKIHSGCAGLLSAVFTRMLAHPKILRDIGSPDLESDTGPTLRDYYRDLDEMITMAAVGEDAPLLEPVKPVCPVRAEHAEGLVEMALDSVIAHELCHYFHGHLAFREAAAAGKTSPPPTNEERRAMEYDADVIGVVYAYKAAEIKQRLAPPESQITRRSAAGLLRDLSLAVNVQFLLEHQAIQANARYKYHPSMRLRQPVMQMQLAQKSQATGLTLDQGLGAMMAGRLAAEDGYAILTGNGLLPYQEQKPFDDPEHVELREAWASIQPRLLPFAYCPLAPPQPRQ